MLLFIGFLIFLVDQLIKFLLISNPGITESLQWKYIDISLVKNTGTVFGLFRGNNLFFAVLAIVTIVIIAILYGKIRKHNLIYRLGLMFILAGALSNLLDRLRFGYVLDYINLRVWPVFNLADSAISVGIALLILGILKDR